VCDAWEESNSRQKKQKRLPENHFTATAVPRASWNQKNLDLNSSHVIGIVPAKLKEL
jgi:hypothetical protein